MHPALPQAHCANTLNLDALKDLTILKTLADLQRELLENCANMVKIGGTIVYATCSLEPEEGQYQIERFSQEK